MRRNWQSVRGEGGDDAAMQYATALAQIADAEFIESIVHGVAALNRFGGELRIAAYRGKYDAAGRKVERDEVGTYETTGYLYDYNHHAKIGPTERNYNPDDPPELEDPVETGPEPDADADGVPWTEDDPASEELTEEPVG